MRYPAEQKQRTRAKMLVAGSRLVKKKGFNATSVDELMEAVGLTGGAFYSHFESKDALFAELIQKDLAWSRKVLTAEPEETRKQWVTRVLDAYLSVAHVRHPEYGCAIPALAADVARADSKVRRAFEKSLKALHEEWTKRLVDSDLAWSVICQLVGAVVITRAMNAKSAVESVLRANRNQIKRTTQSRSRPRRGET